MPIFAVNIRNKADWIQRDNTYIGDENVFKMSKLDNPARICEVILAYSGLILKIKCKNSPSNKIPRNRIVIVR